MVNLISAEAIDFEKAEVTIDESTAIVDFGGIVHPNEFWVVQDTIRKIFEIPAHYKIHIKYSDEWHDFQKMKKIEETCKEWRELCSRHT